MLSKKWAELITQFEAKYPAIKVKYVGLPNSSYLQKVDNALATGQVPDVMLVGNDLAGFVAQKAMEPLDKAYKADLVKVMDPNMVTGVRANAPDGQLYSAPLTALSDVIWYRTDWLAKKGLKPPTSYDQFFEDAKLVTDKSKNRFGFAFRGGKGSQGYPSEPTGFVDGACRHGRAARGRSRLGGRPRRPGGVGRFFFGAG